MERLVFLTRLLFKIFPSNSKSSCKWTFLLRAVDKMMKCCHCISEIFCSVFNSNRPLQVLPTPVRAPTPVQIRTLSLDRNKGKVESIHLVSSQNFYLTILLVICLKFSALGLWSSILVCVTLSSPVRPPSIHGGGDPVGRVRWWRQQLRRGDTHQDQPPQPWLSVSLFKVPFLHLQSEYHIILEGSQVVNAHNAQTHIYLKVNYHDALFPPSGSFPGCQCYGHNICCFFLKTWMCMLM